MIWMISKFVPWSTKSNHFANQIWGAQLQGLLGFPGAVVLSPQGWTSILFSIGMCGSFYLRKIINPISNPLHQLSQMVLSQNLIKTNNWPWKIRCIFSSPKRSMFYEVSPPLIDNIIWWYIRSILLSFLFIFVDPDMGAWPVSAHWG